MRGCDCTKYRTPRFPAYLPQEELDALEETANALIICGKGILAADENPSTLGIRFQTIKLENSRLNRRRYREVLFSTDCSIKKYISGIVMNPDSLEECDAAGKPLIELIKVNRHINAQHAHYQCDFANILVYVQQGMLCSANKNESIYLVRSCISPLLPIKLF